MSNAQTLARTARRVARHRLAAYGLNDQRSALISYLNRHGAAPLYQIADSLDLHRPATAALLARMEADRLVSWSQQANEGGQFSLTAEGSALMPAVRAESLRIRRQALEDLKDEDIELACTTLLKMIANLQR